MTNDNSAAFRTTPQETEQTSSVPPSRPRLECCSLHRYENGRLTLVRDNIGVEEEMEIRVPGRETIVLSRTPGQDSQLVMGSLFTRGLIRKPEDIAALTFSEYASRTRVQAAIKPQEPCRLSLVSAAPPSGSDESEEAVVRGAERIFGLREAFEARQRIYRVTGAMHGAALFTRQGEMLAFAEDIGRHNAFDKVIGDALLRGMLHRAEIALLSSRLALELTMKAAMAGITILAGLSVATCSSVELAAARGITLIGRLRRREMNIYTHPWRLTALESEAPNQASESTNEHRTVHLRGI
ncbi:MAG: formate dehydrogenase accessory sulfurtransferase FdhD [Desulfovibrio sp.]